jgi:hypothetical protein
VGLRAANHPWESKGAIAMSSNDLDYPSGVSAKGDRGVPYKMYVSRALSAWGDRMWDFGGGLFMMSLVCESIHNGLLTDRIVDRDPEYHIILLIGSGLHTDFKFSRNDRNGDPLESHRSDPFLDPILSNWA